MAQEIAQEITLDLGTEMLTAAGVRTILDHPTELSLRLGIRRGGGTVTLLRRGRLSRTFPHDALPSQIEAALKDVA